MELLAREPAFAVMAPTPDPETIGANDSGEGVIERG
jgi:hypothetical protein